MFRHYFTAKCFVWFQAQEERFEYIEISPLSQKMGGCVSLSPEEAEQKRQSEAIDRKLRVDLKEYENTIKILLLGE
jgi:hypothetical protein